MKEERLIVRPFEELRILEYASVQQTNEHAQARVKGWIPFGKKEDYIRAGEKLIWVQVFAVSGNQERILFYGVLEKVHLDVQNQTCMAELCLCSGTRLMDVDKHTRSFQEGKLLYSELLDVCNRGYENAAKIMAEGKGKAIGRFLMQYRETDWEFIKRLAAMNHTTVFADCLTKGEKYHFGIPDRKAETGADTGEYRIRQEMSEYWFKKENNVFIRPEDTISYIWEDREPHKLGEKQQIEGKEYHIWKIESSLRGNELYHTCYMKMRPGFQVPAYDNPGLAGVSLMGKVIKVKDEEVKIQLCCDENQEGTGARWFSFSSIYSSGDGSGWYCMPEPGDLVRLYFPTAKEKEAYVISACHEGGAALRTKPAHKFWRNKEGKEIRLSPERILITNNDGTSIELSDEEGIEIISENSVTIRAGNSLSISSSDSSIELDASRRIRMKQGDTEMTLGGDIFMQGGRIRL